MPAGGLFGVGGAVPTPGGGARFRVGRAPLGPVVAALVPRSALLPAPTPRVRAVRPRKKVIPIRLTANRLDSAAATTASECGKWKSVRKVPGPHLAKPHQAGGGAGASAE